MSTIELKLEVVENNRDLFRELLKDETKKSLAYKCCSLRYDCPIANDISECPFNIRCSEVREDNWNDVEHFINF